MLASVALYSALLNVSLSPAVQESVCLPCSWRWRKLNLARRRRAVNTCTRQRRGTAPPTPPPANRCRYLFFSALPPSWLMFPATPTSRETDSSTSQPGGRAEKKMFPARRNLGLLVKALMAETHSGLFTDPFGAPAHSSADTQLHGGAGWNDFADRMRPAAVGSPPLI